MVCCFPGPLSESGFCWKNWRNHQPWLSNTIYQHWLSIVPPQLLLRTQLGDTSWSRWNWWRPFMWRHPRSAVPHDVLKIRWGLAHFIPAFVRQAQSLYCIFCLGFTMLIYRFVSLYLSSFISSCPFSQFVCGFCLVGFMWFCFGVFFSSSLFPAVRQNQRQAHVCVMTWFPHSLCPYRRPVTPGESGKSFPFGLLVYKTDPVIAFREFCSALGAWRKGARELPERWAITDHLPGVLTSARKDRSSSGTHCINISSFFLKPYGGRRKDSLFAGSFWSEVFRELQNSSWSAVQLRSRNMILF